MSSLETTEIVSTSVQYGMLDKLADNICKDLYNYVFIDMPKSFNNTFINSKDTIVSAAQSNPIKYKESIFKVGFANFLVYSPQMLNSIHPLPIGNYPIDLGFAKFNFTILRDISAGLSGISYSAGLHFNLFGIEFGTDFICLAIQNFNSSLVRFQPYPSFIYHHPELAVLYTIKFAFKPFKAIFGYFFGEWLIYLLLQIMLGLP